jgi:hypothetical protein
MIDQLILACLIGLDPRSGLAARYPLDDVLRADPAVLVFESFDAGSIEDLATRWEQVNNKDGRLVSFAQDSPISVGGEVGRSLKLTAHPGQDEGGHLYTRLPREVDELFLRFYVKFPEPANYVHHFVHMGGYRPSTPWPQGGAGQRPAGDERITVGIEPFGRNGRVPPPGEWNFYTYWHEMKVSAGGRYWGNGIGPARPERVPSGKWQYVEAQLRLNKPGQADGVLGLWLDGKQVVDAHKGVARGPWTGLGFELLEEGGEPFEGFNFRTTPDLKINFVWLLHYVTETNQRRNRVADRSAECTVLFDQIVAATEYIGPIAQKP